MSSVYEILNLVRDDLPPDKLALVKAAVEDARRLEAIRDMFLLGRDAEAVKSILDLGTRGQLQLLPLSMWIGNNAVGQSFQLATRPQLPFRPISLLLDRSIADRLYIHDIRVGRTSTTVAAGAMPGSLFAAEGVAGRFHLNDAGYTGFATFEIDQKAIGRMPLPLDMPLCDVGCDLIITCTNISDAHLPIGVELALGAFYGRVEYSGS